MALELTEKDFEKAAKVATDGDGGDFMNGINKLLVNVNSMMGQASKLLKGYSEIKEKLKPSSPQLPMRNVTPAARPMPQPQEVEPSVH